MSFATAVKCWKSALKMRKVLEFDVGKGVGILSQSSVKGKRGKNVLFQSA